MAQKVFITRPYDDAKILAEEVAVLGFEPMIEPMLIIEPVALDFPELFPFDGLVFTSANGVRRFADLSDQFDKPVFTVGEKTAYEAIQAGFKNVQSAGKDVSVLAELLKGRAGAYAHFRGEDVARSLVDLLQDNKEVSIDEFILYRGVKATQMSDNVLNNLDKNEISYILFYSKRTAKTFVELAQYHQCTSFVKTIKALCLADSMLECLSVLPWKEIRVATHPDQESMLSLLK